MGQLVALEVDNDVAAQQPVVEDEIHVEMVVVKGEALLPRLKENSPAKFQQKALQPVDDGRFKLVFGICRFFFQAQEFQHERVFDDVGSFFHHLTFPGESTDVVFVAAQRQPFIKRAGDLAFQFPYTPTVPGGFDFIELSFVGVVDGEKRHVMGPAERESRNQEINDGFKRERLTT